MADSTDQIVERRRQNRGSDYVAAPRESQAPDPVVDPESGDQRAPTTDDIVQRRREQGRRPTVTQPRASGVGGDNQPAPTFGESYEAGTRQMAGTIDYGSALVKQLLGDEEGAREDIERAETRERQTAGLMSGGTEFQSLVEDPDIGGALQFTKQTLGQLGPMAIESAATGLAGSLIAGPGGGAAATGASIGARAAGKSLLRKFARDSVKRSARNVGSEADDLAFSNALRSSLASSRRARWGATAGAGASEFRQGTGEVYRETVEGGDDGLGSPGRALAGGAGMAALGIGPDKLVVDALANAVRGADKVSRNAFRNVATQVGTQAGVQSATEAGQEELLIRVRDSLTEDDYAASDEAMWRRAEGAAAGAVGGTAIGGMTGGALSIGDAARDLSQRMMQGRTTPGRDSQPPDVVDQELAQGEQQGTLDMAFDEEPPAPESQADIDAQFAAMMGEQSAKQAVEITEGSPLPSGYRVGQEGVFEVDTQNGVMLTTEEEVADIVRAEDGSTESVAQALGYRETRRPGMNRVLTARNEAGNIVHNELLGDEPDETALSRGRQFAPNADITTPEATLTERSRSLESEGRSLGVELSMNRRDRTRDRLQQRQQVLEQLQAARNDPNRTQQWNQISERLPRVREEVARLTEQLREQDRLVQDQVARHRTRQERDESRQAMDQLVQTAMDASQVADADVADGIEVIDRNTGETRVLPREDFENVVSQVRTRNQGENLDAADADLAQRVADEFDSRGYELDPTDTRPITVQAMPRDDVDARFTPVGENNLNSMDPEVYQRLGAQEAQASQQMISRDHRLGPQTEASVVDGRRVPTSAVRQLRRLRRQNPEDDWGLVGWTNDRGQATFRVTRQRALRERRSDDPVVRDVEARDSDAIEQSSEVQRQQGDGTLRVAADPSILPSARERVFAATETARWRSRDQAPPNDYNLRMVDPQGRMQSFNPRILGNAGMDANQYLVGNEQIGTAERRTYGLRTAVSILMEEGYQPDISAYTEGGPLATSYEVNRQVNKRRNKPEWVRVAGSWNDMSPQERFDLLQETEPDREVELSQVEDMDPSTLSEATIEELRQRQEDYQARDTQDQTGQEERYIAPPIRNVDATRAGGLAEIGTTGVRMDPAIDPSLRDMVGEAEQSAQIRRNVVVLSDQTTPEQLRSLPPELRRQVRTDPNMFTLLGGVNTNGVRGRTVHYGDTSVIWMDSRLGGLQQTHVMMHELGHVAYHEHSQRILRDPERRRRLEASFNRDRNQGLVKQYDDPELGFQEWFADRFAAWALGRTPTDRVARSGRFQRLYNRISQVWNKLNMSAQKAAQAGYPSLELRIQPDAVFNQFMEGLTQAFTHRQRQRKRRTDLSPRRGSEPRSDPPPDRDEDVEADYWDEVRQQMDADLSLQADLAEHDAAAQQRSMSPSMIGRLSDDDPVAEAQVNRASRRAFNGQLHLPFEDSAYRNDPIGRRFFDYDGGQQPPSDGQPPQQPPGGQPPQQPPGGDPPQQPPGGEDPLHQAIVSQAQDWSGSSVFERVRQWIRDNLPGFMERGYKALRDLTFTDDARLREHGNIGRRIANMFFDDTYDRNYGERGYLNRVEIKLGQWMNDLENVLPDNRQEADRALAEAQSSRDYRELSRDGKRIRRFLRRFYNEQLANNVDGIQMRENFFPRVYDMSEIMVRPERFTQVLRDAGYSTEQANEIIRSMMEGESVTELTTNDQEGSGPGMSSRLERRLNALDDTVLQNEGFLMPPRDALMQYLRSSVKRSEYERKFAGDMPLNEVYEDLQRRERSGQWVDQEFKAFIERRRENSPDPAREMVRDPSAVLKRQIRRLPEDQQPEVREIVQNYMGRSNSLFGHQMSPGVARTMSSVGGAMYMATLGLSAISQITDLGAITMRTRGSEGIGQLRRAIMEVPRDERLAFARAVGAISHQTNLDALRMSYGNDFMTPGTRKMVDAFFRGIGLEQITNFSRSVGTVVGMEFLRTHAAKAAQGDQRSQRYLDELRVSPEQVQAWDNDNQNFGSEAGNAVREALFQFTDESIIRPNAAMRPGWASNPWFSLLWQLKSFMWGFYKVVVRGTANEMVQRRREGADVSDQVFPAMLAGAVMTPLAYTSMVIRDGAKEGLNTIFDDDEYEWNSQKDRSSAEWLVELGDRSGMLGPWALVNSAYDAHKWGDNPVLTLSGPAAEKAGHVMDGDFERTANDLLPVAGLVR